MVRPPLRIVPPSSSNNGLILVLRIKTVKNLTSVLGFFFFNYYFCGFFLHTSWFLFSFTTPTSAVVSWVFHSLILFLRVRSNHWSHIGSGSRFLCVVPPSLAGYIHILTLVVNSHLVIPVMLYCFHLAPVQGWTRSIFLFISLFTKFLANEFLQFVSLSVCQSVSLLSIIGLKFNFLVLYFQLNLFYEEILYFCSNMSLWLKLLNFKMLKL